MGTAFNDHWIVSSPAAAVTVRVSPAPLEIMGAVLLAIRFPSSVTQAETCIPTVPKGRAVKLTPKLALIPLLPLTVTVAL
jgi:hypothetical protein